MIRLEEEKQDKIIGGASTSITGTLIDSITSLIELLEEAGRKIGSGIRRISENNVCPIK